MHLLPLVVVAAAACADNGGPDFAGTYQVEITGTVVGSFPRLAWPETMAVVLTFDDMDQPQLTLAGTIPRALEFTRSGAALDVRTLGPFPLALIDSGDCDFPLSWTGDNSAIIKYHFEDDRVEAHTSGIAYCQNRVGRDPDSYIADVDFDLVGDRTPEPR